MDLYMYYFDLRHNVKELKIQHYDVNQNNTYTNPISNNENGAYKIIQKFYSFDVENEK